MNEDENMNVENQEIEDNIVILSDEEGNDVQFEFLDLISVKGNEYVVLLPAEDASEEDEDAGEVVILKVESIGEDEESYVSVEDEDTLNEVFEIFKDKFKDEFNFVD